MKDEKRPTFVIETEKIYNSFKTEIDFIRECEPSKRTDIKFKDIVASAYAKSYDFVLYICQLPDYRQSFFQLPMLRSICEDLIALTYLIKQKEENRNYILVAKRYEELRKSSLAQREFFNEYNSSQIIPPVINENATIDEIIEVHTEAGYLFEKDKLPSVHKMAQQTDLKYLYDFIYHATSKAVHFDIFTLLSMGWGEADEKEGTIKSNFSYKHDYKHYYNFTLFYSSYLFLRQTDNFKTLLALPNSIEKTLATLENDYKKIDWPELITFRQMNMKPPSELIRAMMREMSSKDPNP